MIDQLTSRHRYRTLLLMWLCLGQMVWASDTSVLKSMRWDESPGRFWLTLDFSQPVRPRSTDALSDKKMFYVDFYGVEADAESAEWDFRGGDIHHVKRLYYPEQQVLRFVFYSTKNQGVSFSIVPNGSSYRIEARSAAPSKGLTGSRKLIVLDPGHGGKSIGAVSSRKIGGRNILEKEIALQIARRMIPLIDRSPNLEYVITRSGDGYVSLDDRIETAVQSKADLFLSIHLNASPEKRKTAEGFEVYYLGDGTRRAASHLEQLENDVGIAASRPLSGGGNLRGILKDLAGGLVERRRTESRFLSDIVHQTFNSSGPFRSRSRGVKQANFRVLGNDYMPSILAECGFIDNPSDAVKLIDPKVQDQIAALLFNAINRYFAETDPMFRPVSVTVK